MVSSPVLIRSTARVTAEAKCEAGAADGPCCLIASLGPLLHTLHETLRIRA